MDGSNLDRAAWVGIMGFAGLFFTCADYPAAWWLGAYAQAMGLMIPFAVLYLARNGYAIPVLRHWPPLPPVTSIIILVTFWRHVLGYYCGVDFTLLDPSLELFKSVWVVDLLMCPGLVASWLLLPVRLLGFVFLAAGGVVR